MPKITIPLSECMPGMIVAESVRDISSNLMYVEENQELTSDIISKLENTDFKGIDIFVNSWSHIWKVPIETTNSYQQSIAEVRELFSNIKNNQSIEYTDIIELETKITNSFKDNYKIVACINSIEPIDNYTYAHSINVGLLSMLIGKWMKYGDQKIESLLMAGLLHDIGKMKISERILNKPDKLTEAEFEEIKKHSIYSYEILRSNRSISLDIKVGILMHHEKMDGSGYPYGVYSENINDIAKVVAVADVYDAMISERPYQERQSPFDVMQLMQEGVFGKLDTKILLTFLNNIASYYIGTYVSLSDGRIGEVVAINPSCVYRPIVRVQEEYIDLYDNRSIDIVNLT